MRYKVGDRVKYIAYEPGAPYDRVGKIIEIVDSMYLVDFECWHGGHDGLNRFGRKYEGHDSLYFCLDRDLLKPTTHRDRATIIGALVDEKSAQYGDAIGAVDEVLRAYYPDGISPDQYKNLGLIVRISDKLMRLANGHTEDTMEDIFGYLLLMMEDTDGR